MGETGAGVAVLARIAAGTAWSQSEGKGTGNHGGDRILFWYSNPVAEPYDGLYSDLTADGRIVLENAIAELLPEFVPESARIEGGLAMLSGDVMKLGISGSSPSAYYYPESTTNLVDGTWERIPHSDDGVNPFIVTNFNYSSTDGTNRFIYMQSTGSASEFIRIT